MVSGLPRAPVTTVSTTISRAQDQRDWNDWSGWRAAPPGCAVLLKRVSCVRIASGAQHRRRSHPVAFWWVRWFVVSEWSMWSVTSRDSTMGLLSGSLRRGFDAGLDPHPHPP